MQDYYGSLTFTEVFSRQISYTMSFISDQRSHAFTWSWFIYPHTGISILTCSPLTNRIQCASNSSI